MSTVTSPAPSHSTIANNQPQRLLTPDEAAEWLSISRRKLGDLTASKRLRFVQIDKAVRFDLADLKAFVKANKIRSR